MESEIQPLKSDKPSFTEPLNEEIMKGVYVDSLSLGLTNIYVVLEGYIGPPRSKKEYVVARILFPHEALEPLKKGIEEAIVEAAKMKQTAKLKEKPK